MDDMISRLAVIQIIEKMRARIGHNLERAVGGAMIEILDEVGEDVGKLPSALGTNLAEVGTDCISREQAIEICDHAIDLLKGQFGAGALVAIKESIEELPPAQPERTCVNCGRTANNGGWYADGRTRCPIEEHYALPKDGYCHLWEKRNVTDDDYPEGRADE